jgi:hypothetical protein
VGAPEDVLNDDARMDELLAPLDGIDLLRGLIGQLLSTLLTVCFFLALRDRATDPDGRIPCNLAVGDRMEKGSHCDTW